MKRIALLTLFALLSLSAFAQFDPCAQAPKIKVAINQTTGTKLISGVAGSKVYICHFHLVTASAQNIALVEGTGTVCATGTAGVAGGTTAATGWNFAANGGLVLGTGGNSVLQADAASGDDICLLQSGAGQVSGSISYIRSVQ